MIDIILTIYIFVGAMYATYAMPPGGSGDPFLARITGFIILMFTWPLFLILLLYLVIRELK